jgi:DNA topoisomerase VI subunit A
MTAVRADPSYLVVRQMERVILGYVTELAAEKRPVLSLVRPLICSCMRMLCEYVCSFLYSVVFSCHSHALCVPLQPSEDAACHVDVLSADADASVFCRPNALTRTTAQHHMRVLTVLSRIHARLCAAAAAAETAAAAAAAAAAASATSSARHGVSGATVTLRDLFYTSLDVFTRQAESDAAVVDVAALLRVPRASLGVVAGARGALFGPLTVVHDADEWTCSSDADADADADAAGKSVRVHLRPRRVAVDCSAAPVVVSERLLRNCAFFGPNAAEAVARWEAWQRIQRRRSRRSRRRRRNREISASTYAANATAAASAKQPHAYTHVFSGDNVSENRGDSDTGSDSHSDKDSDRGSANGSRARAPPPPAPCAAACLLILEKESILHSFAARASAAAAAVAAAGPHAVPAPASATVLARAVLLTGCGFPSLAVRALASALARALAPAPTLLLTDYNPYGTCIALNYWAGAGSSAASRVAVGGRSLMTAASTARTPGACETKEDHDAASGASDSSDDLGRDDSRGEGAGHGDGSSGMGTRVAPARGLRGRLRWIGLRAQTVAAAERHLRIFSSSSSSAAVAAVAAASSSSVKPAAAAAAAPAAVAATAAATDTADTEGPATRARRLSVAAAGFRPDFAGSRLWTGSVAQPLTQRDRALAAALIRRLGERAARGQRRCERAGRRQDGESNDSGSGTEACADVFAFEVVSELRCMLRVGRKVELQALYAARGAYVEEAIVAPEIARASGRVHTRATE